MNNIHKYSNPDVNIRIAIPDGGNPDEGYINRVKPGGTGSGAWDHKHLFTYKTLCELCEKHNFKATPIEYWDENKQFHDNYTHDINGMIWRSYKNDEFNYGRNPKESSLIVDLKKK